MYNTMYHSHVNNVYKSKWLDHVESILIECGLTNIWLSQGQGCSREWLKRTVRMRLKDMFMQNIAAITDNKSKCSFYKLVKNYHIFENYLVSLPKFYSVPF